MTTADGQPEAPDFLGIEGIMEGMKYKGPRLLVTVSIRSQGRRDLIAQLAESINGPVFIGWGFPQMTMDFKDANAAAFPSPTPVRQMVTPDGEIILAHMFRPGRPNRFTCAICDTPEGNPIHSEDSRKAAHGPQPDDDQAP